MVKTLCCVMLNSKRLNASSLSSEQDKDVCFHIVLIQHSTGSSSHYNKASVNACGRQELAGLDHPCLWLPCRALGGFTPGTGPPHPPCNC